VARTSALCLLLLLLLLVASAVVEGGRPVFASDCERGVLDAGEDGMNVLVYELCDDRLTVGFESSDVIEEITCEPDGDVRLWMSADHERCAAQPAADAPWVYDLLEPLQGIGRTTSAPVTKRLKCGEGTTNRATIVIPNARAALLETRTGDTIYEQVTRRFIRQCVPPGV
jgi:hypothetical protein